MLASTVTRQNDWVEPDNGRGGGDLLTLLQLHIGQCTKSDWTAVKRNKCLLLQRSVAGGRRGSVSYFTLSMDDSLHGVQAASALRRPWLFALRFWLSYGHFPIRISDPKFDIRISGYRLTTLVGIVNRSKLISGLNNSTARPPPWRLPGDSAAFPRGDPATWLVAGAAAPRWSPLPSCGRRGAAAGGRVCKYDGGRRRIR